MRQKNKRLWGGGEGEGKAQGMMEEGKKKVLEKGKEKMMEQGAKEMMKGGNGAKLPEMPQVGEKKLRN